MVDSTTLDIFDLGTWLTAARVIGIVVAAYLAIMWIALVTWAYRDIQLRTTDPWTQATSAGLVGVFFVPGLLLYLAFRPRETLVDAYNRELEAEAFRGEIQKQGGTCTSCRRTVREDFRMCPYCRSELRAPCASCKAPLQREWVACPFCSADRPAPMPAQRPAAPVPARRVAAAGSPQPAANAPRSAAPALPRFR